MCAYFTLMPTFSSSSSSSSFSSSFSSSSSSFSSSCSQWSHNNYYRLLSLMTEEEKATFNFDLKTIEWDKYIDHFCMGTKKYMLKEDVANLPAARRQIIRYVCKLFHFITITLLHSKFTFHRLRNIRYTFNIFMFLLATRLVYLRSSIAREMWTSFMSMCLSFLAKLGLPLLHPS